MDVEKCSLVRRWVSVFPDLPAQERRGVRTTHAAIKHDNSAVLTENFGRRSTILLTFIGSHQYLLWCINTE